MNDTNPPDELLGSDEPSIDAVIAALAERDSTAPPPELRASLLARIAAAPRIGVEPIEPVELYAARVAALAALLGELASEEWSRPAEPYAERFEWSVHALVAHLLVIERYTADVIGLPGTGAFDRAGEADHLEMGADAIAAELGRAPAATTADWTRTAAATVAYLRDARPDLHSEIVFHGRPNTIGTTLVARSFEIWTHGDDVRRATGRPLDVPAAAELRTMSSLSVSALPLLMSLVDPGRAMAPTRIVLTGAGGGTFDIGPPGPPAATLVADVVDYCRVAARRIDRDRLSAAREGDTELISALLQAAGAFAM